MRTLYELIKKFEGLRLKSYLCPAGVPTIGYGATGPDVQLGQTWTAEQAEQRMESDAAVAVSSTKRLCPTLAGDEAKLSAIADFTFNLGPTRLAGSTLRRRIREGRHEEAADELLRWVRGGGRVLPGLVLRRRAERDLYLRGDPK